MDLSNKFAQGRDILIDYKVYLAGQYAPAQEVVAQQGLFSFSEAQVTLFPHKELVDFGEDDRVPVQIFFLDTLTTKKSAEYKLLFEGEVVNDSYDSSPNSIGMSISCVSHFEVLAQMFKVFFTDLTNSTFREFSGTKFAYSELGLPALLGNRLLSNAADDGIKITDKFDKLFTKEYFKTSNNFMKRPYVLLRNIMLNIVNGVVVSELKGDISLFLQSFISKRDIIRTIFASPLLEEGTSSGTVTANIILNALNDQSTIDAIGRGLSLMANVIGENREISYWELIVRIYSVIMHEALLPLCPPFLKADIFGTPSTENNKYEGIMHLLTKPAINFGVPPRCNTIFPCMIDRFGRRNDHFTKPTRAFMENPSIFTKQGASGSAAANLELIKRFANNATGIVYPEELGDTTQINKIQKTLLWDLDGEQNEFFKGPVTLEGMQAPDWMNYIRKSLIREDDKDSKSETKETTEEKSKKYYDAAKEIVRLFTATEFQKEVSSRKTINLELKFNPFLIVGFPAVVIEKIRYGMYFYGLPVNILHRLHPNGASTSVQMTNIIGFKDALVKQSTTSYDVTPYHPSSQVSDIFNKPDTANAYYRRLLYQSSPEETSGLIHPFTFNPYNYFYLDDNNDIDTTSDGTKTSRMFPGIKDIRSKIMVDYSEAIAHVARPITSMSDYLTFKDTGHYFIDTLVPNNPETGAAGEYGARFFKTVGNITPHGGTASYSGAHLFNGIPLEKSVSAKALLRGNNATSQVLPGVPVYYEKILGYTYLQQLDANGERIFNSKPTNLLDYPDFIKDWAGKVERYRKDTLNLLKDFPIG